MLTDDKFYLIYKKNKFIFNLKEKLINILLDLMTSDPYDQRNLISNLTY
jgi:hypothetical protein